MLLVDWVIFDYSVHAISLIYRFPPSPKYLSLLADVEQLFSQRPDGEIFFILQITQYAKSVCSITEAAYWNNIYSYTKGTHFKQEQWSEL